MSILETFVFLCSLILVPFVVLSASQCVCFGQVSLRKDFRLKGLVFILPTKLNHTKNNCGACWPRAVHKLLITYQSSWPISHFFRDTLKWISLNLFLVWTCNAQLTYCDSVIVTLHVKMWKKNMHNLNLGKDKLKPQVTLTLKLC